MAKCVLSDCVADLKVARSNRVSLKGKFLCSKGDVSIYVRMDGWIDLYQLRLITG